MRGVDGGITPDTAMLKKFDPFSAKNFLKNIHFLT